MINLLGQQGSSPNTRQEVGTACSVGTYLL